MFRDYSSLYMDGRRQPVGGKALGITAIRADNRTALWLRAQACARLDRANFDRAFLVHMMTMPPWEKYKKSALRGGWMDVNLDID